MPSNGYCATPGQSGISTRRKVAALRSFSGGRQVLLGVGPAIDAQTVVGELGNLIAVIGAPVTAAYSDRQADAFVDSNIMCVLTAPPPSWGSPGVVHGGVSQVVLQVLDGALAGHDRLHEDCVQGAGGGG
jgi:hypothetical protein